LFTAHDFVWGILIPGAIALLLSLGGVFLRRPAWVMALAMGLAFLLPFPAIHSDGAWEMPRIPPADSTGWLLVVGLTAIVLGILDALSAMPRAARAIAVVIVAATGLSLFLKFKFQFAWSGPQGCAIIAGFALLAGIWWAAIEECAREQTVATPLLMWLIASCSAVVVMFSSKSFGMFFLPLASGAAAIVPIMAWRGAAGSLRGVSMIFSILMTSMLAGSIYLAQVNQAFVAILASVPLFVWLGGWIPRGFKPWQRAALRIVLVLIPLSTVLTLAAIEFRREGEPWQGESVDYPG
jgi:hypothetical protein